jgi:anaerobic dimethyl sulfoxide reductase subunit B (iron-sulfur subunit)
MTKCNFCEDYLSLGLKPACVDACPMRALDFGTFEEMTSKYGQVRKVYPLPDPTLTGPGLVILPHKDAARAENENSEVTRREDL